MVKFCQDAKQDPSPPRFIEWWRYSHPAAQRIDFALSYRPGVNATGVVPQSPLTTRTAPW
jgi:hypothetical protein